jgi:hypothetical protein
LGSAPLDTHTHTFARTYTLIRTHPHAHTRNHLPTRSHTSAPCAGEVHLGQAQLLVVPGKPPSAAVGVCCANLFDPSACTLPLPPAEKKQSDPDTPPKPYGDCFSFDSAAALSIGTSRRRYAYTAALCIALAHTAHAAASAQMRPEESGPGVSGPHRFCVSTLGTLVHRKQATLGDGPQRG